MNNDPKNKQGLSVCLLTYNHKHLIESTVRSVLEQDYQDFEFIISDDYSTDGSWELIQYLAASDSRIRPMRTPKNLGMPGNANFAVSNSTQPYIALLHHDDIYDPKLLTQWSNLLDTYPEVGFVFNDYRYESGQVRGLDLGENPLDGEWFLKKYLLKNWGSPVRGTAMVRRDFWEKVDGMRESFNLLSDVDLWMRLSRAGSVGYVSEALITVRHNRPEDYPDIYRSTGWSWLRQKYLYEIHATNHLEMLALDTIPGRLSWWRFRARLSVETLKWLGYAVIRHKSDMILTSSEGTTSYDLPPVKWIRALLLKLY